MKKDVIEQIVDAIKEYVKELLNGYDLSDAEKSIITFEIEHMPFTQYSGNQSVDHVLFRKYLHEHALIHKLQQKGFLKVVEELPTEDIDLNTIYLVHQQDENGRNLLYEYIYYDGKWELIGTSDVDLSLYFTKKQVNELLDSKVDDVEFNELKEIVENINVSTDTEALRKKIAEVEQLAYAGL